MAQLKPHQRCVLSGAHPPQLLGETVDSGRMLFHRGQETEYLYTTKDGELKIYRWYNVVVSANLLFSVDFGPSSTVIDCIYFPLNDKQVGLVVAVYDPSREKAYHIAYVSMTKQRILKRYYCSGAIKGLTTVVDGVMMPEHKSKLCRAFQDCYPHILGISVLGFGAVITYLGFTNEDDVSEEPTDRLSGLPNLCCLCKGFLNQERVDKRFVFNAEGGRHYEGPTAEAYVTSFLYVEESSILVMGFSFGGIFIVSLRTQQSYAYFFCEGRIDGISVQWADDDPRGFYFLWFALKRAQSRCTAIAANVTFAETGDEDRNNPVFVFNVNFSLPNFGKFISLRALPIKKSSLKALGQSNVDESMNISVASTDTTTSLMLFTWITDSNKLCGALFDMNMYYFKRMPSTLRMDNTLLRQYPMVAAFVSDDSVDTDHFKVLDVACNPNSFSYFCSTRQEVVDQLFYPSVYNYSINVLANNRVLCCKVVSLQNFYLSQARNRLRELWTGPVEVTDTFYALGIIDEPYEKSDRRFYLLNALLWHGKEQAICEFILDKSTGQDDHRFITRWVKKEIDNAKEHFDGCARPLFNGQQISRFAEAYINHVSFIFNSLSRIIDSLYVRVESDEILTTLKVEQSLATTLFAYTKFVHFCETTNLLPELGSFKASNAQVKSTIEELVRTASRVDVRLKVMQFVDDIMSAVPDASVWQGKTAEQWYPPENIATWAGFMLNANIAKQAKVTLFAYYLLDFEKTQELPGRDLAFKWAFNFFSKTTEGNQLVQKVRILWLKDRRPPVKPTFPTGTPTKLSDAEALEELYQTQMLNNQEIRETQQKFFNLTDGVFHWNLFVIKRRKFDLISEMPPETPHESNVAKECRVAVKKIEEEYPCYFIENPFKMIFADAVREPESVLFATPKAGKLRTPFATKQNPHSDEMEVDGSLAFNGSFKFTTPKVTRSRKAGFANTPAYRAFKEILADPEDEVPSTPEFSSPVVAALNVDITEKQRQRINDVTKATPTTPAVNPFLSPVANMPKNHPTSILKSRKAESRIGPKTPIVRLKFNEDELSTVQAIPNRFENRMVLPDVFAQEDSLASTDFEDDSPTDETSFVWKKSDSDSNTSALNVESATIVADFSRNDVNLVDYSSPVVDSVEESDDASADADMSSFIDTEEESGANAVENPEEELESEIDEDMEPEAEEEEEEPAVVAEAEPEPVEVVPEAPVAGVLNETYVVSSTQSPVKYRTEEEQDPADFDEVAVLSTPPLNVPEESEEEAKDQVEDDVPAAEDNDEEHVDPIIHRSFEEQDENDVVNENEPAVGDADADNGVNRSFEEQDDADNSTSSDSSDDGSSDSSESSDYNQPSQHPVGLPPTRALLTEESVTTMSTGATDAAASSTTLLTVTSISQRATLSQIDVSDDSDDATKTAVTSSVAASSRPSIAGLRPRGKPYLRNKSLATSVSDADSTTAAKSSVSQEQLSDRGVRRSLRVRSRETSLEPPSATMTVKSESASEVTITKLPPKRALRRKTSSREPTPEVAATGIEPPSLETIHEPSAGDQVTEASQKQRVLRRRTPSRDGTPEAPEQPAKPALRRTPRRKTPSREPSPEVPAAELEVPTKRAGLRKTSSTTEAPIVQATALNPIPEEAVVATPVKRSRGRPPKNATPVSTPVVKRTPVKKAVKAAEPEDTPQLTPRRSTRKRAASTTEHEADTPKRRATSVSESSPIATPKRRTRNTPKH